MVGLACDACRGFPLVLNKILLKKLLNIDLLKFYLVYPLIAHVSR